MDQKFFDVPFAFGGDQSVVPDGTQSDGSVSFTEGWGFDYQRDLATDPAAKPVDRSAMNYLFYAVTAAVAALQKTSIAEWVRPDQNNGTPLAYPKYAMVRYSATNPATTFETYVSMVDGNTSVPGADTNWQTFVAAIATGAMVATGTDNRSIVTPAALKSYPGNTAQTFSVADAVSGQQAVALRQMNNGTITGVQRFTTSGTFTAPVAGTYYVSGCGAGGGGGGGGGGAGGNVGGSGGGGGAGQSMQRTAYTLTAGQSLSIVIGAGGAGGNTPGSGSGTAGGTGGNTTITALGITLNGGSGGGGGLSVNATRSSGGNGGSGYPNGSDGMDSNANAGGGAGGSGASLSFGGGGGGARSGYGLSNSGGAAYGYGAGGGGGGGTYQPGVGPGSNGGNGASGCVFIEW